MIYLQEQAGRANVMGRETEERMPEARNSPRFLRNPHLQCALNKGQAIILKSGISICEMVKMTLLVDQVYCHVPLRGFLQILAEFKWHKGIRLSVKHLDFAVIAQDQIPRACKPSARHRPAEPVAA